MTQMKHLSIVDGAFLHMESAEMPMHVGSLNLFEPPAGYGGEGFYEKVKAHVAKRMHLAPVFTRKLALMPFDLANPVWIHDDDIDLDYHVRYMVLPKPGSIEQLEALAARLHSMLLDRSRPLWEFYVIEGLADGRIGFYGKVHHAAVDGQAGVAMATSMFDLTPEPRAVKPPRESRANTYQLGVAELLAAALQNQLQQLVQSVKLLPKIASTAYGAAQEAIATRRSESKDDRAARQAEAPPTRFKLAPATPFNHSITNQRAFAAVSLPLPEVKAIGKAVGASINDVVLWLCSTALRSYLKEGRGAAREVARRRRADLAAPGRRHDRQQPGRRHADRPRHRDRRPGRAAEGDQARHGGDEEGDGHLPRRHPDRLPFARLALADQRPGVALRALANRRLAAHHQRDDLERARLARAGVPVRREDDRLLPALDRRPRHRPQHHGAEPRRPALLRPDRVPARRSRRARARQPPAAGDGDPARARRAGARRARGSGRRRSRRRPAPAAPKPRATRRPAPAPAEPARAPRRPRSCASSHPVPLLRRPRRARRGPRRPRAEGPP